MSRNSKELNSALQRRYRERIATGELKRLQIVVPSKTSDDFNRIAKDKGVSKTDLFKIMLEHYERTYESQPSVIFNHGSE